MFSFCYYAVLITAMFALFFTAVYKGLVKKDYLKFGICMGLMNFFGLIIMVSKWMLNI